MRAGFYRLLSRLLPSVLDAASLYVTADAQTHGHGISMVRGPKWLGGDPLLQRQNVVRTEARGI